MICWYNPLAQPGDADYRNLYIAQGDGSAGENSATRTTPQRLDALQGKILRITPDLNLRPADELSANGRYRIPTTGADPNPFTNVSLTNLKKEIFAYGFRNCHRISWDPVANLILEDDIGLNSWEEVNIVRKGNNYGYSEREGAEQLFVGGLNNGLTGSRAAPPVAFPTNDTLIVTGLVSTVTPIYPVALYSHWDGDGISSGFVYRGSLMPGMYGKYIFGDIANGRVFYADFNEMLAADDGNLNTVATTYELQLVYNNPLDVPDLGYARWRMFDIVAMTYTNRGGNVSGQRLPGTANSTGPGKTDVSGVLYGSGRVDLRLCQGSDNEIYVISKSDGSIRKMVGSLGPPAITNITNDGGNVTLTWQSVPGWSYRLQYKTSFDAPDWTDVSGDVMAAGITASKVTSIIEAARFYRVKWLP
ncbi:MAG: PQQ-dependent sugar dehydrogenase [Verrucomicrobiota bacterium]